MKNSILKLRKKLLNENFRRKFFSENRANFEKNILKIIKNFYKGKNKKWKIYVVVGSFLGKKLKPYDYDAFSSANLIAATKQQGYEIMLFLNKSRLEFLSLPALLPLILHEIEHIKQAEKNPKEYLLSILNDKLSRKLEQEAEKSKEMKKLKEKKREYALESILYCYEIGGWENAGKMAKFLFNRDKLYGGGYEKGISKKEYKVFLEAKKKKDIGLFIEFYL